MQIDLVERARIFATAAHAAVGQVRRYTGKPYIVHPAAVAGIVSTVKHSPPMLAAAWLHDVVEDTGCPIGLIRAEFGDTVAALVDDLTDPSTKEDGNRQQRRAIDRAHSAKASPSAKTVKLADIIDNTTSIVRHDRSFARLYLSEIELLLPLLAEGDAVLHARASAQARAATEDLR